MRCRIRIWPGVQKGRGRELAILSPTSATDYMEDYSAWFKWSRRREDEIKVLDNWRACRAYLLQVIKMTLYRRAKRIDPDAVVAQRLKRRPSIEIKLGDNPNMKLSQMQDTFAAIRIRPCSSF